MIDSHKLDPDSYRYTLRRWEARRDPHGSQTTSDLPNYHIRERVDLRIRCYLHQKLHLMLIFAAIRYQQNFR